MPETYQTLVYSEQGGDAIGVKSNGIIRGYSGGIMSAESGFNFALASQAILAKDVARIVHSMNDPYLIYPSAGISVLAVSNLPYNCRIVKIVGSTAASKCSFWLTSCSAGAEVFIFVMGTALGAFTNNNTSVKVSLSGVTLLGSVGAALSNIVMHTSAASNAFVHMVAPADNVWAIVHQKGDVDEAAAA